MTRSGGRSSRRRGRSGKTSGGRALRLAARWGILAAVGAVLAAAVVLDARTSRIYEAPQTHPSRLLWARLDASRDAADAPALAEEARQLLARHPLDAQAAGLIAVVAARQGATAKADELMQASFDINRRNLAVNAWLFDKAVQARRFPAALTHADIMLRRSPEMDPRLFPILIAAVTDPTAMRPMAERLKPQPRWRTGFIFALADDERTLQLTPTLFTEIQAVGGRIEPYELSRLLVRLTEKGRFEQAYLNWVLFNPIQDLTKLRYVYDGEFEGWPEVAPFSWRFGNNAVIEAGDERPGEVMHVSYDGVSASVLPSQLIMLTPGAYRLSLEYLTRSEEAGGRLAWTLTCAGAEKPLVSIDVPHSGGGWKRLEAAFEAPSNCPAQMLALIPHRGDRRASVEVWFDKVEVQPEGAAS